MEPLSPTHRSHLSLSLLPTVSAKQLPGGFFNQGLETQSNKAIAMASAAILTAWKRWNPMGLLRQLFSKENKKLSNAAPSKRLDSRKERQVDESKQLAKSREAPDSSPSDAVAKSRRGASRDISNKRRSDWQCAACLEPTGNSARVPCGHDYCPACINRFFLSAVKDETLYPPRCCSIEIPLVAVTGLLSHQTVESFKEKAPEWLTQDRTYCSQALCSTWIPPNNIQSDIGTCPSCRAQTCTLCKAEAHHDEDCPSDEGAQKLIKLAKKKKWQRCYQCRRLIELTRGCNHMTCVCRAEWCYLCRAPWGTCECRPTNERNLWQRAEGGDLARLYRRFNQIMRRMEEIQHPEDEIQLARPSRQVGQPMEELEVVSFEIRRAVWRFRGRTDTGER
ncbi:hypothetical protein HDK90DRAFT_125739 [Phyllosticta capitalensis]|uniref:RBR-type E3 ubiquitin transferase n=2 Tax=Phyllosticta capitalensis TaxID=121624 RepID=A0ABR1YXY0_9PEZI